MTAPPVTNPVRVLVVDDSAIVRRALTEQLNAQPGITVVGSAPDPYVARDLIFRLKPEVLTLDIEMPRMNGLTFLQKVMKFNPMPVIIVSSLTPASCQMSMDCLAAGAIHVACKPQGMYSLGDLGHELGDVIRGARSVTLPKPSAVLPSEAHAAARPTINLSNTTRKVVAIGASTGGTEALAKVFSQLPRTCPGTLIVQHMPPGFTTTFAERLNNLSEMNVKEAQDGEAVLPGTALLAPGGKHLALAMDGARYVARVFEGPRVKRHQPSVEVLFKSTAKHAGKNAIGVIMTGMGDDGGEGMLDMKNAGCMTVAQDEPTSVVYGMPKVAADLGAAQSIVPLERIPDEIINFAATSNYGTGQAA
ncbi:MAG: chemotaxis response regulator protein-glutamate methylesterase [Phycisphaerales bacterium]